jgi:hypothetical protein
VKFREHSDQPRPHSALADRTPAAFAALHRPEQKFSTLMGRETRVNRGRKGNRSTLTEEKAA